MVQIVYKTNTNFKYKNLIKKNSVNILLFKILTIFHKYKLKPQQEKAQDLERRTQQMYIYIYYKAQMDDSESNM